ncbi:MAG: hypothetical protein JST19_21850 [Bacteroidetes bacterium]|nr:hypothetical protein [Bacteroidota bacterium]
MVTIDTALDEIMQLDFASREMLLEILQKRQVEARRSEMAKNAKQSLKDYHAGKTSAVTADEAIQKLKAL